MKTFFCNVVSMTILLSLSWMTQEEKVFARVIEGTPSQVVDGKVKMPRDFTPKASKPMTSRLRLPVMLVPYKKVVLPDVTGKKQVSYVPNKQLVQTLRARLDRPNHFYFEGYHIETRPVKWDKVRNQYQMDLTISQTFGVNQQIEEQIGKLRLEGSLLDGPDLFRYDARAKRKFTNKLGYTLLDVQVGWPSSDRFSRDDSKKPWKQKMVPQHSQSSEIPGDRPVEGANKKVEAMDKPVKRGWSQG